MTQNPLMEPNGPLYNRAMETIPGVVAARQRGAAVDAAALLNAYRSDAETLGADDATAWCVMATASMIWISTLVDCRAQHHNLTPLACTQELARIASAAVSRSQEHR